MSKNNTFANPWFAVATGLIGVIIGIAIGPSLGSFEGGLSLFAGAQAKKFTECLESGKFTEPVKNELNEGSVAGVSGTPGTVAYSNKTGKSILVSGAQPIANFEDKIKKLLEDNIPEEELNTNTVVPPDVNSDHIKGDKGAEISLIVYTDFQCPYCGRVHPTLQQLVDKYKGQVNWVYRHFPLSFHQNAQIAAEATECAADLAGNEAFWQFTDKMFEKGTDKEIIIGIAKELKIK